jgi:hypothetical protein
MLLNRRIVMFILAVLLCGVYSGCYRVYHVKMSDQDYPPKPESYNISVFEKTPGKPYIVIAHIYADPRSGVYCGPDDVIARLKKRAKELGADALIVRDITMAPAGTVSQGCCSGEGDAIVWTK